MISVDNALAHAVEILNSRPDAALNQALEVLKAVPNHPIATLVVGSAERLLGRTASALNVLGNLARAQPRAAHVHFEYGLALVAANRPREAILALRYAGQLNPTLPGVWLTLADQLRATGDGEAADSAYTLHVKAATRDPRLLRAAAALTKNEIPDAESLLREHLRPYPNDVAALRMLAEAVARRGRYGESQTLLLRCLELAPSFAEARANYATVLERTNRQAESLQQIDRLLAVDPTSGYYRNLKAAALVGIGEYRQALELFEQLLQEGRVNPRIWVSYGNVLRTLGRLDEAVAAYRKSIELDPGLGDPWWSLSNLKTYRFSGADVAAMQAQLDRKDSTDDNRVMVHFALGKAYEDAAAYQPSFQHYAEANRLRRGQLGYQAESTTRFVQRSRKLFTSEFLRERTGAGCAAPDPIFILGLPRSGSTLVEQILSSHSQVEGTMELGDITTIARRLGRESQALDEDDTSEQADGYPQALATLAPEQLRALGEEYITRTRVQRKTAASLFIDKTPNNFLHLGLIHLVLPNAKIIDVRRHPLSSGFSVFKQHFARGQGFSYSLEDIGQFYRDYVELMAHFDQVLPGRVHRVHYESLVENTEHEVRALLDYCQLPFEEACLRFYENKRAVRTPSSEQVRQPIFREGLEQWRHYEPWLEPLELALGPVLQMYPEVPPLPEIQRTSTS
jgi:tetratricopeptide (TPR) repeat protein